ncbi:hypothetical protein C1H46_012824 [Malus baccata]|uniref:Leo1-like protein n=1 Tax=Malus baccata TaxID=106549 RepID=A0A540MS42_MALBA|nr:hypothetical protein C1H46_012824 [Malus baccata]
MKKKKRRQIMLFGMTSSMNQIHVEEDTFVTDESGSKKRIRLENNIVRQMRVRNPDGTTTSESNARFVRWSDGSLQLLIGNEVLDISVQEAQHDQAHLFLRHEKVKNCVTDIDPEREKEEKERAESQNIRANLLLNRKKEKVSRKYTTTGGRRRQLSPGFLEDALDEGPKDIPRKSSLPTANSYRRSMGLSDESEYETDEEDEEPPRKMAKDSEPEYEDSEEHHDAEVNDASEEEEAEAPKQKVKNSGHKRKTVESDEDSPPRKAAPHRRMAVVYDSDED